MSHLENAGKKGYCFMYIVMFFVFLIGTLIYVYMQNRNGL